MEINQAQKENIAIFLKHKGHVTQESFTRVYDEIVNLIPTSTLNNGDLLTERQMERYYESCTNNRYSVELEHRLADHIRHIDSALDRIPSEEANAVLLQAKSTALLALISIPK